MTGNSELGNFLKSRSSIGDPLPSHQGPHFGKEAVKGGLTGESCPYVTLWGPMEG